MTPSALVPSRVRRHDAACRFLSWRKTVFRLPLCVSGAALITGLMLLTADPLHAAETCTQFGPESALPVLLNEKLQPRTTLLCNAAYAVLNSGEVHEPLWSAEYLDAAAVLGGRKIGRTTNTFVADDRLPAGDGATLADYRGSGFDRGHMVPSADAGTEEIQEQTFTLSNVVPQTAALNEGIWTGVEMAVRAMALREGGVYVVTGPDFTGSSRAIGQNVLVPTATWKAIYDPIRHEAGAYLCQNTDSPTCQTLSVADLAERIGIDPFPGVGEAVKAQAMTLPEPQASPYASRSRENRDWERLQKRLERKLARAGMKALRHALEQEQE
ncbi:DNA/RNA non-specific endonuclease [Acetobacter okinawensis]|uniref:DNA/RNA non-specific endonuclease n=1 Tax=Acetobacter okinawensis TaxID=1076594 RepID=UPI000470BAEF|nr:DNA/RNA non-specific endonuclease [Acetobacter okinawensis]